MKTFRFDDICANTNIDEVKEISEYLLSKYDCKVIWAMSILSHKSERESQRVFPSIYTAHSDHKVFYNVDSAIIYGKDIEGVTLASHGLIHVDHRLLGYEAQEMSILVSCSLAKAKIFIPPFNKWNSITEEICNKNGIELVKFEDGWLSMEHNKYNDTQEKWYLHHWKFNLEKVKQWSNS